eukprot:SAG31_NODE_22113_length_533_cov_1.294931_1_plen_95_part_00
MLVHYLLAQLHLSESGGFVEALPRGVHDRTDIDCRLVRTAVLILIVVSYFLNLVLSHRRYVRLYRYAYSVGTAYRYSGVRYCTKVLSVPLTTAL